MIPGASSINFDEITKERIFQSIDSANMQLFKDLEKDYNLLKFKLGRIPMMMDFIEHGSRDPYLYVDYSNSYYNFFVKVEKSEISVLTAQEIKILELFAKEINNGKRIVECYILKLLIELESIDFEEIKTVISTNYNYKISKETYNSCINNLNFKFVRKEEEIIKIYNDKLIISKSFYKMMQNKTFKDFLIDNINYSIFSFNKQYKKELFKDGFILYQKYSRKDVCRILNWDLNEEATVYGYKLSNNSCPIFVNYHKEENIASSTKFPEKFLNSSQFLWYTKPQRRLSNSTIAAIKNHKNQLRLPLFMKKHNGEGTDFYFMGDVKPIDESFEETTIKNDQNNDVPVVKVILELATPVESTIYNYLTYKETDKEFPNNVSILNSNIEQYIINPIPLYDFYAAAGTFSEMQSEKDFILIEGPENYNPNNDYFACKIMGESMNRVIPNDSICLFKKYTGGSRNGKILLIEYRDIQDPDFNSAFTIKTYTSEKNIKEENWEHTSIILRPNSYDSSYQNIIITDENAQGMRVVGEFVQIMKECIK
jgi:phage repressor protein C with HTH and peptisase S24 domain